MRSRLLALAVLVAATGLLGLLATAQTVPLEQTFTLLREIGRPDPSILLYDPVYDRFVQSVEGDLEILDASTLQPIRRLYGRLAPFSALALSHDGRFLAVAIDRRVDLWELSEGRIVATFSPDGSLSVTGPLIFSQDDRLLLLNSVVPAPQETRRSESDTNNIPYLWDVVAARDEERTLLPNRSDAYAYFNYRNGLVIGGNRTVVAGVPGRLLVLNAESPATIVAEIGASRRLERDPLVVWQSITGDFLYVQPNQQSNLVQINTQDDSLFDFQPGAQISLGDFDEMRALKFSRIARVLGNSARVESALLRWLLGENYRAVFGYTAPNVMLLDVLEPVSGVDQHAFLVYIFDERANAGSIELIQPDNMAQYAFSPDFSRLAVRSAAGVQSIGIYEMATGQLEQILYPSEPDVSGRRPIHFGRHGAVVVVHFERFDRLSGDQLVYDQRYTVLTGSFGFDTDSRYLFTYDSPNAWRRWDIETGMVVDTRQPIVNGQVVDVSSDGKVYLTTYTSSDNDVVVERYNSVTQERDVITLASQGYSGNLVVNETWDRYLLDTGTLLLAFDERGQLLRTMDVQSIAQDGISNLVWVDEDEFAAVSSMGPGIRTEFYGLLYHPSGLPQCLVDAYPAEWSQFVGLWEVFIATFSTDRLNSLNQNLCRNLPASAQDVIPQLTPTLATPFVALATPRAATIANVPRCLTLRFTREAFAYAEAWRIMSAGLSDEERSELEEALCEGLLTSLEFVRPTATVDPLRIGAATSTPVSAAPEILGSADRGRVRVSIVNVITGDMTIGDHLPPQLLPPQGRSTSTLLEDFRLQFGFVPSQWALSQDGSRFASLENGVIRIYGLSTPYPERYDAIVNATATANAQIPRLQLEPTPTTGFAYGGTLIPTITPTITPTARPTVGYVELDSAQPNIEVVCPYDRLFHLDEQPQDSVPSGKLLLGGFGDGTTRLMNLADGAYFPDERLPRCAQRGCEFSPDRQWILSYDERYSYARIDGSNAVTLFNDTASNYISEFRWIYPHHIQIGYNTYAPNTRGQIVNVTLYQVHDVVTGESTDFVTRRPYNVEINTLPAEVLALQPVYERFALVRQLYGESGSTLYIYDAQHATALYLLRTDVGRLENYAWNPNGKALYMWFGNTVVRFDAETQILSQLAGSGSGSWSPSGAYTIASEGSDNPANQERIQRGDLPIKIVVWDELTGVKRAYCVPESGTAEVRGNFLWSPDEKAVVFSMGLPPWGDTFYRLVPADEPTPTAAPSATPVNLELEYQLREPRLMLLDLETGSVTVIATGSFAPFGWMSDEGQP
jgi:WD40 repeat protein